MSIIEFLDSCGSDYELKHHRAVFTAQEMAQEEHIRGMNVIKPVIVRADGRFYMCVVPACCKINFDSLKSVLEAEEITLADETDMDRIFTGCQIGAEPPFGSFFGLPTIMDDRLEQDDLIIFPAGTHQDAIEMKLQDYMRIESPRVYSFTYHI
ncbi:MAG: YbaK/EbsC family protein [Planctomycetes bacterium]|nr:YbaK/EbsC family protein [Planctomycetota bacterium]